MEALKGELPTTNLSWGCQDLASALGRTSGCLDTPAENSLTLERDELKLEGSLVMVIPKAPTASANGQFN